MRHIALAEHAQLLDDAAGLVVARTKASRLCHRIDTPTQETSVFIDAYHHQWCLTGDADKAHIIRCAEVAQAVGYKAILIDLDGTHHMRTVAIDNVGSMVYAEVCQLSDRAAILTQERLGAIGEMTLVAPLGTAVKRHDDDVARADQRVNDACHIVKIDMAHGVVIMTEGTESYLPPMTLHDSTLLPAGNASIEDALLVETALGGLDALQPEVVGMVVGHAQEVEACLLEARCILGGHAKGIAARAATFGAGATIAEHTFKVAYGQVGSQQNGF